ncbi:MAG: ORF6N domain-containing protein [Thermoguttaceae bacterium]
MKSTAKTAVKSTVNESALTFGGVEEKIVTLRDEEVILDSDLALLYGVPTKAINQAIKNNPDKFPVGYVWELTATEKDEVVKSFDHLKKLKFSSAPPRAFTEKGAYMLATILKGKTATATTISIVEAFANLRKLSRTVAALGKTQDQTQQKSLLQKSGEIFTDLLGDEVVSSESETTFRLNLAVLSLEHTVKRKKKQ